jgi:hypothetical protein
MGVVSTYCVTSDVEMSMETPPDAEAHPHRVAGVVHATREPFANAQTDN